MNDFLKPEGIFENGFGFIAKKPMLDERLTIEAKAIYAFMCSYAGAGGSAFPSVDYICRNLRITRERFYKHRKLLVACGYIEVETRRKDGKQAQNVYKIVNLPVVDEEMLAQWEQDQEEKREKQRDKKQQSENQTTENQQSENQTTENQTAENPTGINNSIKKEQLNKEHGEKDNMVNSDELPGPDIPTDDEDDTVVKSKKAQKKSIPSAKEIDEEFEHLWKLYPNKKGKATARTKYAAARKKGVTPEIVEEGIKRLIKYEKPRYYPHGSTWFGGHRWEDEYEDGSNAGRNGENRSSRPKVGNYI